jgi:hypothetical protein
MDITVKGIEECKKEEVVNEIIEWFNTKIEKIDKNMINKYQKIYNRSPLIDHIKRICDIHKSKYLEKKIFIFVTDGQFNFEELKFLSNNYSQSIIEKIKKRIIEKNLKPFSNYKDTSKINVILLGLNYDNNHDFDLIQKEFFNWLFEFVKKDKEFFNWQFKPTTKDNIELINF